VKLVIIATIASALLLCAQQSSVTSTSAININGDRVADGPSVIHSKSDGRAETTEIVQSINGRTVPIERVEQRVVREDSSGRVVERLIRRYDQTGNPTTPVKEVIAEQKRPDGSSTKQVSTYRGDINGGMQLIEKSTTETQVSGSTENAETVVQRPTVNGTLDTVEKESTVKSKQPSGFSEETTTYRRDGNGGFRVAVRETTEHSEQGAQSSDSMAEYELGPTGQLQLHSQKVTKTVTGANGSKEQVVDIFGQNVPGTVDPGGLKLQEQQLIQKKPGPNDTVTQTLSVRRPSVSDPKALGPARQLSETVCRGKCDQ
jgi:hypothetical protein